MVDDMRRPAGCASVGKQPAEFSSTWRGMREPGMEAGAQGGTFRKSVGIDDKTMGGLRVLPQLPPGLAAFCA